MNNLIKIEMSKKCIYFSSYLHKSIKIKNVSEKVINSIVFTYFVRGKIDKKDYKINIDEFKFTSGLLPGEETKIRCYSRSYSRVLSDNDLNDMLIIARGYDFIVEPLQINSFYNFDLNQSEAKKFLNCEAYNKLILKHNLLRNKEVDKICS